MSKILFNEQEVLSRLKRFLPEQASLKDFILQNSLNAFKELSFEEAISRASKIFGYKTSLNIQEYRDLYKTHVIREDILEQVIINRKGKEHADEWIHRLFQKEYDDSINYRIEKLRPLWKKFYHVDLEDETNPILFKLLAAYLDQGIALWHFPFDEKGFLASVRNLEAKSVADFVRTDLGIELLANENITITDLLKRLVGEESLFENYLFDQQFSHPGWSGIVAVIERNPKTLLDQRPITLEDIIKFELILEIDGLEYRTKKKWQPLGNLITELPEYLFAEVTKSEEDEVRAMWQEAYEWSYFDSVLAGIQKMKGKTHKKENKTFQAFFCIDDREGSIRRHIENIDHKCETYGTPGHFGLEFYYQPKDSKFYTKVCPAPITPKYIIKEIGESEPLKKDIHFSKYSHHAILGYFFSLGVGFWSGLLTFFNIFKPNLSSMASSSFSHMGKNSKLSIENVDTSHQYDGLQIGFTVPEMIQRVETVLRSTGVIKDFANIIYIIGHGSSSINNPFYAEYDCGACSSRPGSVNARVFSHMANDSRVREALAEKGIVIPDKTQFLGGIHDTCRDEIVFYDEDNLSAENMKEHQIHLKTLEKALDMNAKERSRRFFSINSKQSAEKIHELIRNRSVSLFEPRPELNHSNNSLCIVGRHSLNEGLFLDRRAFANSYDYSFDPDGTLLTGILNAATPVCGGINLQYFFSRTDVQKIGSGSKLPHNVVGLIGVINGIEGDLRPGLAWQMVDLHDPVRLMMIVEHYPEVVLSTIQKNPATYEWYLNEWVLLAAVHPETQETYRFSKGKFTLYQPLKKLLDTVSDIDKLIESHEKNMPVYLIKKG